MKTQMETAKEKAWKAWKAEAARMAQEAERKGD